jgi:hypothetical protein
MWNEEKREEDDNNNDDETEWGKERYVNCDGDIFYMNKFSEPTTYTAENIIRKINISFFS